MLFANVFAEPSVVSLVDRLLQKNRASRASFKAARHSAIPKALPHSILLALSRIQTSPPTRPPSGALAACSHTLNLNVHAYPLSQDEPYRYQDQLNPLWVVKGFSSPCDDRVS